MSEVPTDPSTHLEPPSNTTEKEDAGAEDSGIFASNTQNQSIYSNTNWSFHDNLGSDSGEEHFSDASEGHDQQSSNPHSAHTSPVPRTRVERVDSNPQHGEVPGTEAYNKREQDAVPDQVEIIPEGSPSLDPLPAGLNDRPTTPDDSSIPRTMVEKVDPDSPSYGEVPGTEAFEKRQADAVPDLVKSTSDPDDVQPQPSSGDVSSNTSPIPPIPETHVSLVDSLPIDEDSTTQPRAHHRRSPSDATPDVVETVSDTTIAPGSPSTHQEEPPQEIEEDFGEVNEGENGADDFDDFVEEQNDMGDDDFGDFDDGFQEPSMDDVPGGGSTVSQPPYSLPTAVSMTTGHLFPTNS